jgi:hypothetical protein
MLSDKLGICLGEGQTWNAHEVLENPDKARTHDLPRGTVILHSLTLSLPMSPISDVLAPMSPFGDLTG